MLKFLKGLVFGQLAEEPLMGDFETVYVYKFAITDTRGKQVSWEHKLARPVANPWRNFLKWYHGRPQSESYVMVGSNAAGGTSHTTIRRENIYSFQTDAYTEEKEVFNG